MFLSLVAACGDTGGKESLVDASEVSDASTSGQGTSGFVSGSRLRAEVRVFDDEVRHLVRWWDTELNESCRFYLSEDGSRRCLPGDAASAKARTYADSSCTEELVVVRRNPCQKRKYIHRRLACGVEEIYVLGDIVKPTTVYNVSGCSPTTASPNVDYIKLGEAAPLSLFVAAGVEREARGNSELEAEVIVADDGTREVLRGVRASDGAVCSEIELTELCRRCVPQPAIYNNSDLGSNGDFHDSACTEPRRTLCRRSVHPSCDPHQHARYV